MSDADEDIPDFFNGPADREVVRQLSETVDLPEDCVSFLLECDGGEVQLAPHANVFPQRFSAVLCDGLDRAGVHVGFSWKW